MIRASNQFAPKTKVVDILFLYNFYFGQISSCHMKFRVSISQTRVKIDQRDHCAALLVTVLVRRRALNASAVAALDRHPSVLFQSWVPNSIFSSSISLILEPCRADP